MSSSADRPSESYDGLTAAALAARVGVPSAVLYAQVSSTLDVAHSIAPHANTGTLILAEEQVAGRGRQGKRWTSLPGSGIWLTLVERPADLRALDVLALRCGLLAARALDAFATHPVMVKWPNDLYSNEGKLAGILIETRWRGAAPEWVAIGFGLNVVPPDVPMARGLRPGVSRMQVLESLIPALRSASSASGPLTAGEEAEWHARDFAVGKSVVEPAIGVVQGISAQGEIRIRGADGLVCGYRSGSLTFVAPDSCS